MEIREMTIDDYEEVYSLWKDSEGVGLSSADSRESIDFYLKRNPSMSFIAVEGKKLIGAILCGHDGRRGFIHHLAVDKNFKKNGIAKALVLKSLEALEGINIKKCHIFIFVDNAAKGFWESIGWSYRNDIGIMSYNIPEK